MKVILLTELKGRGGEGDVVEVNRGFANNYLLPKKMAVEATPGNLKQLESRMHNIRKREEIRMAEAGDFRGILDGKKVSITVKVGEAGRLFGSVTPMMIAQAITKQLEIEVDRRKIETRGAIKTIGVHEIEVSVYRDIKAHMTVDVLAEGSAAEVSKLEADLAAEVEAAKAGEEPLASSESLPEVETQSDYSSDAIENKNMETEPEPEPTLDLAPEAEAEEEVEPELSEE